VYRYDLGITVDDVIYFKTSYSLGVPWMTSFVLKQVILSASPWLNLGRCETVAHHFHKLIVCVVVDAHKIKTFDLHHIFIFIG